jgi:hypothetical protein
MPTSAHVVRTGLECRPVTDFYDQGPQASGRSRRRTADSHGLTRGPLTFDIQMKPHGSIDLLSTSPA